MHGGRNFGLSPTKGQAEAWKTSATTRESQEEPAAAAGGYMEPRAGQQKRGEDRRGDGRGRGAEGEGAGEGCGG
eukprot:CAMPEP_0206500746 /NCGR_PEP_ID=MMETSP0324_2-20121206/52833_1 /ASSEMBLY_ACC=CAM_ASM_000836 /TAXON_ID=2866 /ORGANISM="Crypthecodinium cohnii, Strain Seligo" /LENGTH=73 /DNA_ID=CAMNT_0053988303 /DNA_START=117 /DNA_END=336 /DNA_ORIENTATION=-